MATQFEINNGQDAEVGACVADSKEELQRFMAEQVALIWDGPIELRYSVRKPGTKFPGE
jgi:hypothetical protein